MTLLAVRGLVKSFGNVFAVDGIDFSVEAGEMVAVIGPNGAGKSTCFNVLGGQLRPDAGQVLLDGRNVTGLPPEELWRQGVGRTFQVASVVSSMTARENVQLALMSAAGLAWSLSSRARQRMAAEADGVLKRVGLRRLADHGCGTLAYGDLKRLELAIALANAPHLLLMDEPTAGMSRGERGVLMEEVAGLVREQGLGVLFTEHDMDVVFGHAHRVLVLHHGRIIAEGTPEVVREDPKVREIYLGTAWGADLAPA